MKASCVITSYNNGVHFKEAVDSALQQTRPFDEIILADDGSTDGSRELIHSYAKSSPAVRPLLRPSNLGVSANRDLALRDCQGDIITHLDGDDVMAPDKLESELKALNRSRRPDRAIAFSDVELTDGDGKKLFNWGFAAFAALSQQDRMKWIAMRFGPFPRDMLMPKALYLESGGLDHSLARFEDWDLKLRLAGLADWVGTQKIGVRYRRHGSGLSNVDRFDLLHAQTVVLMRNRRGIEAAVNPSFFEKAFVARWLDVFSVASGGLIP